MEGCGVRRGLIEGGLGGGVDSIRLRTLLGRPYDSGWHA
jgi:hypothetical protein